MSQVSIAIHPIWQATDDGCGGQVMGTDVLCATLKEGAAQPCDHLTISFEGIGAMSAGISFFRRAVGSMPALNPLAKEVHYKVTLDPAVLDEDWVAFLAEHHFVVGVALNGTQETHSASAQEGCAVPPYRVVMAAIQQLKQHQIPFYISTTVTPTVAQYMGEVYEFYIQEDFVYQQYQPHGLDNETHLSALITLFDCWWRDRMVRKFVAIREFDHLAGLIKGFLPEDCGMTGRCQNRCVVLPQGGVYPCKNYTQESHKIGIMGDDSFATMERNYAQGSLPRRCSAMISACKTCRWVSLCRGGCPLEWEHGEPTHYCEVYKAYYEYAVPKMIEVLRELGKPPLQK